MKLLVELPDPEGTPGVRRQRVQDLLNVWYGAEHVKVTMFIENKTVLNAWACPDCQWMQKAHPNYGWAKHDSHAVEVHQTQLCPNI